MKIPNNDKLEGNLFGAFRAKIMKIQIFCCRKRPNKFLENQKEFSSKMKLIKIK